MNTPHLKTDILFSPFNDDEFLLVSNNLFLYRIANHENGSNLTGNTLHTSNIVGPNIGKVNSFISDSSYLELLSSVSRYQSYKHIAWYPYSNSNSGNYAIALHEYNNNQILVLNLLTETTAPDGSIIVTPIDSVVVALDIEHQRTSHQLQWNLKKTNYLAASFEKQSNKSSIYIWDAAKEKSLYQLDEYETCYSLCWHPEESDLIFASSSYEYISLFDLKAGVKACESFNTSCIKGFCIDPNNFYRAVSYDDNKVAIWDLRKLNKPLAYFEEPKSIRKLQFCPTKPNNLAVLYEGSNQVNVYRLDDTNDLVSKEKIDYLKNCRNNPSASITNLSSFSWHSMDNHRLLILNSYNNLLDLNVSDYCPIEFSFNNNLNVVMKNKIVAYDFTTSENANSLLDIGEKMKQRAIKSYGSFEPTGFHSNIDIISEVSIILNNNLIMNSNNNNNNNRTNMSDSENQSSLIVREQATPETINQNLSIRTDNMESDLKYLWHWCELSNRVYDKNFPMLEKYAGVLGLLFTGQKYAISVSQSSQNLSSSDTSSLQYTPVFFNELIRNHIFKLCEWNDWNELVEELVKRGEYERAACVCAFNRNLDKAMKILTDASQSSDLNEYLALSIALNHINNNLKKSQQQQQLIEVLPPVNPDFNRSISIAGTGISSALMTTPTKLTQKAINITTTTANIVPSTSLSSISTSSQTNESNRILSKLTNPYLKALFSYHIDPENYDYEIYNDPNILIPDRVCMAMNILKPDQLVTYIKRLGTECISLGYLYGVLLLGLKIECLELFQSYINRTGDVQTPAVVIIHSNDVKVLNHIKVDCWIRSYRELLDSWMLWTQRALYDIIRAKPVEPKIYLKCGYCGDNISTRRRQRNQEAQGGNIGMTCQACQKPSLRCAVCSLYMSIDPPKSALAMEKDKMAYWFIFCVKCNHGGHMGHLTSWFKNSPECPVMSCECQCSIREGITEVEAYA